MATSIPPRYRVPGHGCGLLGILLVFALVLMCGNAGLSSCTSMGPLKQPAEAWVRADRATYDVIASRFIGYVQTDTGLSETERTSLIKLIGDWRMRLEQGELVYPKPAPALTGAGPMPTDPAPTGGSDL